MNRLLVLLLLLSFCYRGVAQVHAEASASIDLSKIEQLQIEGNEKIEAAFTAMKTVQEAGRYINALSDLFGSGEMTLPVGIRKGDYELIIQKITHDEQSDKSHIHATCAFRFRDTGQKAAFEGQAEIQGINGLGTRGELSLIAPVRRDMGKTSTVVVHEGSRVRFGCDGIEDFAVRLTWMITSPQITPTTAEGQPVQTPISTTVDAIFEDFDNYIVSFNVDRSFMFRGLKDVFFTVKGITLDRSDTETSAMTVFPEGYLSSGDERNLWRGVSCSEASVSLPAIFKPLQGGGRMAVSMKNALFDENGFTGDASVSGMPGSALLDLSKWDLSIDHFKLGFLKNELIAAGFGGDINIPPFGKNSLFPYTAAYNHATEEFDFDLGIGGKYDFPVLASTLTLHPASTIELSFRDSDIYPVINASGVLTVNAPLGGNDSTSRFTVPDIAFENMRISREAPYVSIGYIGVSGNLQIPQIAGFEVQISNIRSFDHAAGSGLAFDADVSLSEIFGGKTGISLYGDYARWKFDKVGVDKIYVDFKSRAFSLSGGVWLKNGDALYGNGFRGDVSLEIIEKFKLDAVAVFGKKDDYRYFLTDVFFEAPPPGIIVPPALGFYGFGGGLYRRMQQTPPTASGSDFGKSLSGIHYIPDRTVSMGVMASTKFGLSGSPKAFNAKVNFEMQFNSNGGLNFIQFRGDAAFMDLPDKWGKLSENISGAVKKVESEGKITRPATKEDLNGKVPENKSSGFLTAAINVKYDLVNSVFTADLNAYLNAGLIRGIGANDRMGWASAYFSPNKWYTYIGTPSDRIGLEVLRLAKLDGYFMIGNDIPGLPLPPEKVLRNLSADKVAQLKRNSDAGVTFEKGIAFGAGLNVGFNAKLPPFYASFGAGLGGEFLLVDMNGRLCSNFDGVPGINGWYASAQAWAYVEAAIGIEARIFKKNRKFDILNLSVGTLLQGKGPNPMYFAGSVGGRYSVLGGLIKGNCSFDFEVGEECIPARTGSPFDEEIIAQITPAPGAKEVNVFAAPQALFNIPVEKSMTVDDDGVRNTYKVTLEEFTVTSLTTGAKISGRKETNQDGTVSLLDPDEPFGSRQEFKVFVKVGFARKTGNSWVAVSGDDGKPVYEEKEAIFQAGDRPKEILPEHVKYSYPAMRQYNYYPDEYTQGYMQVTKNYSYLFREDKPEGFRQIVRISDLAGQKFDLPFTYAASNTGSDIRLEINFSTDKVIFADNRIYKLTVMNVPEQSNAAGDSNVTVVSRQVDQDTEINTREAEGTLNLLSEKEIYALHFRTSRYRTFKDKMSAFDTKGEGWREYVEPFVHHVKANLKGAELFDKYEMQWDETTLPLVRFDAQLDRTSWFGNSVYPSMYKPAYVRGIVDNRKLIDGRTFGEPPVSAVLIEAGNERQVTDAEITTGTSSGYAFQSVFTYTLPYWCSRDFYHIKTQLAEKSRRGGGITASEAALLAQDYPQMVQLGSYPIKVRYVLPGKETVTSVVDIEMYCPVK
ncbi:MAG: hypothetical protein LBL04_11675 [Bacteroidales bacterium]|jgi:hypothetical protein|nr:hypothetical protein [Bacteroidales bacterium]